MSHTKNLNLNVVESGSDYHIFKPTERFNDNFTKTTLYVIVLNKNGSFSAYILDASGNPSVTLYNNFTPANYDYYKQLTKEQYLAICNYGVKFVRSGNLSYSLNPKIMLEYSYDELLIKDIVVTGTIDTGLTVSWSNNSAPQTNYTVELKSGNNVLVTKTGADATSCYIPYNELPVPGSYSVVITLRDTINNQSVIGDTSTTLTMEPLVSPDLNVTGDSIDGNVVLTWNQPTMVDSWTIEAYRNDVLTNTFTGTTAGYTIPPRTLPDAGNYKFIITLWKKGTTTTDYDTANLTRVYPTVSGLTVTGDNIDYPIMLNWTQGNVESWEVQCLLNGNLIKYYTGNAVGLTINPGELPYVGDYTFNLIVHYSTASATTQATSTLIRNEPFIVALEPSGVNTNKDKSINCSWTTHFQDSFVLIFDGIQYAGTTQTSISIPANTVTSLGNKSITLTITYTSPWGEVRKATKTVTFNAVGTPNAPQLDGYSYYSVATPTFTWTCVDAFAQYRVQVYKDDILVDDSNDVVSNIGEYTCATALENNTLYKVRVKVKTQYGYWSEWASKTFTTNFIVANKPDIQVFVSDNGIVINSFTVYTDAFSHCNIYRRTEFGEWIRIAYNLDNNVSYTDAYVGKETYYYKVTSVSTTGGKNDSDEVQATVLVKNFNFSSVENLSENVEFVCEPDVAITIVRTTAESLYDGVCAPIVDVGEQIYKTGTCSFLVEKPTIDKFISVIRKAKVLLYRDGRGEKIFCHVVGDVQTTRFSGNWYTVSFRFTEVPFLEEDLYRGDGNQSLVFWDGTWRWDGTITWDGEGTLV